MFELKKKLPIDLKSITLLNQQTSKTFYSLLFDRNKAIFQKKNLLLYPRESRISSRGQKFLYLTKKWSIFFQVSRSNNLMLLALPEHKKDRNMPKKCYMNVPFFPI